MERTISGHEYSDEDDRRSRYQSADVGSAASLRERAASQPPRSSDNPGAISSPPGQHYVPANLASPWPSSRMVGQGRVQPMPVRSSSFSTQQPSQFSSVMRERAFASTFEDDESEELSDTYDERYFSQLSRGRNYGQDPTRSRSQSLATTRPGVYSGGSTMQSWNEPYLGQGATPLSIPSGGRYGDIKPPGSSRYGSLGTLGNDLYSSSPTSTTYPRVNNGSRQPNAEISNISPFVRDINQILLDESSALRELWPGMNPPRDLLPDGGGSGTTSRRHSVSIVQPRRGNVVGFNAPSNDFGPEETPRGSFAPGYGIGRGGGLKLTDDDLASDLGLAGLSLNDGPPPSSSTSHLPPSQPASLPIFAPLSRSPPSRDLMSAYQPINLTIPTGSYSRNIGTPSEGEFSLGGNSPPRQGMYEKHLAEQHHHGQQQDLQPRFIPGQGIQYLPNQQSQQQQQPPPSPQYTRNRAPSYSGAAVGSPISPTSTRAINPQQPPFYPQTQRRPSDAHNVASPTSATSHGGASLQDLGKGVPLHAVPPSWPLFIVEFKAGRTDLFYLTDLSVDIRVGDLVVVEADRGKDLGKVVNDSITIGEVETWVRQQQVQQQHGGGGVQEPLSPGGATSGSGPGGKKEINPKMIYGKAGTHELQLLASKTADEQKALQLCQTKVKAKKLPMEVIDAEYQWDRRKLTFYFIAEKRIDFRELVRELFRLYKTRIWMASLQGGANFEQ